MSTKQNIFLGVLGVIVLTVSVWFFPLSEGCWECIPTITPERAATIEHRGYAIATYEARDLTE